MEVWIGEAPIQEIWRYHQHFGTLVPETISRLEQAATTGNYEDRWPVMVLGGSYLANYNPAPLTMDTAHTMTLKKSISIN